MNIFWATLYNLKYFIFLPFFLALVIYKLHKTLRSAKKLSGNRNLLENFSMSRSIFKSLLLSVSIFFLFLCLLSPQYGEQEKDVVQSGRDVLIALDISKSMLAQDESPSRMDFAKAKIKKLLSMIESDRVGLVIFSSDAFVQCPLTRDRNSFLSFLNQVDAESISGGTTNIASAINSASNLFNTGSSNAKRLFIIFTDGEDFSADIDSCLENIKSSGLSLVTVGLGSLNGVPIPVYDENGKQNGFIKKSDGSVVISKLNEDGLKKISTKTGGAYIKSSKDDSDVKSILKLIESLEKQDFGNKNLNSFINQYNYFALVSFLAICLEWVL